MDRLFLRRIADKIIDRIAVLRINRPFMINKKTDHIWYKVVDLRDKFITYE